MKKQKKRRQNKSFSNKSFKKVKTKLKLSKRSDDMLKKMAWNAFKKTGSIDIFLELKEIDKIEKMKEEVAKELTIEDKKVEKDGTNQD